MKSIKNSNSSIRFDFVPIPLTISIAIARFSYLVRLEIRNLYKV